MSLSTIFPGTRSHTMTPGSRLRDFLKPGPRAGVLMDRAGPGEGIHDPWITCDQRAGVVEIHDPRLLCRRHEAFCRALVDAAVSRFGATRAVVYMETATCRLEFVPGEYDRTEISRRVTSAVIAATPSVREGSGDRSGNRTTMGMTSSRAIDDGASSSETPPPRIVVPESSESPEKAPNGRRRLWHTAMAGGSFALAIGAVILPGIPTLPFLIMTGRHAILVSPRIERFLRRNPWCAALLEQMEPTSGSTIEWRWLAKTVGLAVLLVAGIWILQPPLPVVLLLEFGLMAFLAWREWCGSDEAPVAACAAA